MANIKTLILNKFSYFDLDQLISTAVLTQLLSNDQEVAHTYLKQQAWGETTLNALGIEDNQVFSDSMEYALNRLQLANIGAQISGLNWKWNNGNLELEFTTADGSTIDPLQIKMVSGSGNFKQVIFLGLEEVDDVKSALQPYNTDIISGAETIALLFKQPQTKIAHQQFVYDKTNVYADLVWQFSKQEKLTVNKEQLTSLLTAIYWRTNGLTNQYTNASLVSTASELLAAGAKLPKVAMQVFSTLSGVERDVWVKALSSAELETETNTLWAEIDRELAFEYSKINHLIPTHSPLYFLSGAKASFVLLPLSERYTEVLATTSSKDIRLKSLFKDEKVRGDNLQAQVGIHLDINATKAEILKRLQNLNSTEKSAVESSDVKTQEVINDNSETESTEIPDENIGEVLAQEVAIDTATVSETAAEATQTQDAKN